MKSVLIIVFCVVVICGGIWMTYDTYKNPTDDSKTTVPNGVYYIKGVGTIALGLYVLISYINSLF